MERQKLIKPVTILKVKDYLQELTKHIQQQTPISLDVLARTHSLSGSVGTALIRMKLIKPSGLIKGYWLFDKGCSVSDATAIEIMENIRVHNLKLKSGKQPDVPGANYPVNNDANKARSDFNNKANESISLHKKDPQMSEIAGLLKKVLSNVQTQNQLGIFDGTKSQRSEQLQVLCAIASSAYNTLGDNLSDHSVHYLNERIVSASLDLLTQFNEALKSSIV